MPNILFKSFDGPVDKDTLERALGSIEFGTCVSITNDRHVIPHLRAKEHLWMQEGPLREGRYDGVDWNTIAPIDEELIERMRGCEAVFMHMIAKYAHKSRFKFIGDIPYDERKRQYFEHLRFWNDFLDAKQIDVVLMYHVPHKCYDWVLYHLCKLKGVSVLFLEHLQAIDSIFVIRDWEESVAEIRDALERLYKEYDDPSKPVPLSENYQFYFEFFRKDKPVLWYKPKKNILARKSFILKWWRKALKVSRTNPRFFVQALTSPSFWSQKLRQHRTIRFYDEHVHTPDLTKPYVYFPLHYQPEASTVPTAGAYADQERIVQLIAAYLPKGVSIFVKEHPIQGERYRSIAFYKTLLAIPSVTFVPKETDTFQLSDNALAIATATGTAGFEGFMRQKPVLMFGHYYYQYGRGIYRIRTAEDCKRALERILSGKHPITERDVRLFLKAMEQCATPYPGPPESPVERYSQEEKTSLWAALIEKHVRREL